MAELTARASDLVTDKLGGLRQMADQVNYNVTEWYRGNWVRMLRTCTLKPLRCAALLLPVLLACCVAQKNSTLAAKSSTGCYKFHTEKVVWATAKDICNNEGGYLGIINSNEEALIFSGLFSQVSEDYSRYNSVGFHDLLKEGDYVTVLGDPLASTAGYTSWAPGEPNNYLNEDCGSISHTGLFNDMNCGTANTFICELYAVDGVNCPTSRL